MEFSDYVEIQLIFQMHSSIILYGIKVHHKTQKQNDFYEVQSNLVGDCEDYCFLGFPAT